MDAKNNKTSVWFSENTYDGGQIFTAVHLPVSPSWLRDAVVMSTEGDPLQLIT